MSEDFSRMRRNMVDCQLRTSDVTNPALIGSFLQVPREEFAPDHLKSLAYIDEDLPLGGGRYLLAPASLGRLLQAAGVQPGDRVLDVGAGCGYSTAVLAGIAASVVALETDPALAAGARDRLALHAPGKVEVATGPLADGVQSRAPFDVIFAGGALGVAPERLLSQLANGGRMVAVMGEGNAAMAMLWVNDDGNVAARRLFNCATPPLPGFERKAEFAF